MIVLWSCHQSMGFELASFIALIRPLLAVTIDPMEYLALPESLIVHFGFLRSMLDFDAFIGVHHGFGPAPLWRCCRLRLFGH